MIISYLFSFSSFLCVVCMYNMYIWRLILEKPRPVILHSTLFTGAGSYGWVEIWTAK